MALFNKNKEDKKHKGENIIGKIIYMFLLFAPLFSILTTCMYVTFNKNAYESYSQEKVIKESVSVSNTGILLQDTLYEIDIDYNMDVQLNVSSIYYYYNYISIDWADYGASSNYNYNNFAIYKAPNDYFVYLREDTTVRHTFWGGRATFGDTFSFAIKPSQDLTQNGKQFLVAKTYTFYPQSLDNAFDYSLEKIEDNQIFNWSKHTGTYTIMKTTTDGLGITNTFTPMLLTYWLIISIIYFIYDIALMLIWILHRKIHELTESV